MPSGKKDIHIQDDRCSDEAAGYCRIKMFLKMLCLDYERKKNGCFFHTGIGQKFDDSILVCIIIYGCFQK